MESGVRPHPAGEVPLRRHRGGRRLPGGPRVPARAPPARGRGADPRTDGRAPAHIRPIGTKALVFRVEDLAGATRTFRDLGVTTVWEQMDLGDGSISTAIRDNDGNLINVFQQGASPIG
ncbi:VOC family protein [Streptomyces shenzhenensis]|uniref:VOC family protein n=1 Tax=Streptomyces shenzhenensis TaxID=943815 RepID=UPI003558BD09